MRFDLGAQLSFCLGAVASFCFGVTASFFFSAMPGRFGRQTLSFTNRPSTSTFACLDAQDFFFDCLESHRCSTAQFFFLSSFPSLRFQVMTLCLGALLGSFSF